METLLEAGSYWWVLAVIQLVSSQVLVREGAMTRRRPSRPRWPTDSRGENEPLGIAACATSAAAAALVSVATSVPPVDLLRLGEATFRGKRGLWWASICPWLCGPRLRRAMARWRSAGRRHRAAAAALPITPSSRRRHSVARRAASTRRRRPASPTPPPAGTTSACPTRRRRRCSGRGAAWWRSAERPRRRRSLSARDLRATRRQAGADRDRADDGTDG